MINYDKLKLAHEIAANLFEHFVIEINIMHGAIGSESGRLKYNYNYQNMGWDNEIPFPHVEYLLCELQKLQKPEPKYKIGQIVYLMGSDNHPIDEIKIDEIIYDEGDYWYLVYTSEGDYSHDCREFDQYREDCLYPSRQEFIESQIEYWLSLSDKSPTEILCGEIVGRAEKKLKYWQSLSNSDDANQCEKNSDECNHQWGGIITCENCGVLFDNSLV